MPKPKRFDEISIILCFFLLDKFRSRSFLADKLNIGEGSVRYILDKLKQKKLIISSKKGHIHSKNGSKLFSSIKENISVPQEIGSDSITKKYFPLFKGNRSAYLLLKRCSLSKNIYLMRDAAIKEGCDGAVILKRSNKGIKVMGLKHYDNSCLLDGIKEDDKKIILITTAQDTISSLRGLIRMAILISKDVQNIIKKIV